MTLGHSMIPENHFKIQYDKKNMPKTLIAIFTFACSVAVAQLQPVEIGADGVAVGCAGCGAGCLAVRVHAAVGVGRAM